MVISGIIGLTAVLSSNVWATSGNTEKRDRVVTFYDDDEEITTVTSAGTVGDALKDANITLSEYDSIDPSIDTKLDEASVVVNIRRGRPVVVMDGSRQIRVITPDQSVAGIASVANIKLYAEDQVSLSQVDDILDAGGAGLKMTIVRAKVINLELYGQQMQVRTQANTVAELLKEKNITLGADDGMSLNADAAITDQMQLRVWRNGIQTVTVSEVIAFTTRTIQDSNRKVGYHEVQTAGSDGEKTVIYEIEMRNGEEIGRKAISEVINTPAVEQIEVVGTKVDLPVGSHEDWMAEAGISSSDYGYVNRIISAESGWRITVSNSSSGAYGLCQALPGSKMASAGDDWRTNPITQLKWCSSYAGGRYGSWEKAYNFWNANHWW